MPEIPFSFTHKFPEWDRKTRWVHDRRRCLNCGVSIQAAREVKCGEVQKLSLVIAKIHKLISDDIDTRVLNIWR